MKRKFLIIIYLVFAIQIAKSQNIGINSSGANPDGSAMLDIAATNKGLLVPRVALTATNATGPISTPLTSLFVYNTATAGTAPNNVIPGYYYWNGAAWVAFNTSTNTPTGWSLTGNAGTNIATNFLGNTDATDFLFKTNNLERMRINSAGNIGIGSAAFNASNPEKLLVDAGTTLSTYAITAKGSIDNFFQFNIQNQASTSNASTDIVATANNGTDIANFVDLGINSSGYNVAGALGKSDDGYLISAGNDFYLANTSPSKDIIVTTGGSAAANEKMRITSVGNVGIGTANPNASAILDVSSTNKGLLVPRVALTATNAAGPITAPLASLFVYNTATAGTSPNNVIPGYYYWNGTAWVAFTTSSSFSGWSTTGNSGTSASTNFIGTTDATDFLFKTNNTERMRVTSTGRVLAGFSSFPLPGTSPITAPVSIRDTLEIRRTSGSSSIAQIIFSNTSGNYGFGNLRISGDGGDLYWQGGGGKALQMGSYWTTILGGDIQSTTLPAFVDGTSGYLANRGVLVQAQRNASIPLSIQGFSVSQTANLTEWLNSAGTAVSVIDTKGNMGIGSGNFNATNQEKLLVDAGVTTSPYAITAKGSIDNFFQFNIQNQASTSNASTDIVATANNGTDLVNFVNLGINSSGYNVVGALGKSDDGYLISAGNDFYLANTSPTKDVIITTGGSAAANERMRVTGTGNVGIGTVGASPTSTLQVKGSISLSTLLTSGAYTIASTDHIIINTGAAAAWTLPAANAAGLTGRIYRIINQGTGNITLSQAVTTANATTTTTVPFAAGTNNFEIISDGTVWRKIN